MWGVVLWIIFSVLVGGFASSKRRSGVGWFFLSMIISPLIAFIIVAVAGFPKAELKKCPDCAEEIKAEANVCRFCGHPFVSKPEPSPHPPPPVDQLQEEPLQDKVGYLRKKFNELSQKIASSTDGSTKETLRKERDRVATELKHLKQIS